MARAKPAAHGRAPHQLQYPAAEQTEDHRADQAAEQEGFPHRPEPVLQPAPAELKRKMVRRAAQQQRAQAVRAVVEGHHREGVDHPGAGQHHRQIDSPVQRHQHGDDRVHRQRYEGDGDAGAERAGDGMAIERPQERFGDALAEHAQVPALLARGYPLGELLDDSTWHRRRTLAAASELAQPICSAICRCLIRHAGRRKP